MFVLSAVCPQAMFLRVGGRRWGEGGAGEIHIIWPKQSNSVQISLKVLLNQQAGLDQGNKQKLNKALAPKVDSQHKEMYNLRICVVTGQQTVSTQPGGFQTHWPCQLTGVNQAWNHSGVWPPESTGWISSCPTNTIWKVTFSGFVINLGLCSYVLFSHLMVIWKDDYIKQYQHNILC